jgi:hemerythrin-like domain-containing protein
MPKYLKPEIINLINSRMGMDRAVWGTNGLPWKESLDQVDGLGLRPRGAPEADPGQRAGAVQDPRRDAIMTPTEILREEHRVILRALALLETAADRLAAGGGPPEGWWQEVIGWLRTFADRNHHAKEEHSLFPALARAGVPADGGPVAVMLEEHVEGRALIQGMEAGQGARRADAARRYLRLLRDHIDKENGVLFPLTDAVLDERAQQTLAREFETVEAEQGRAASIVHAEADVDRLAGALG